MTCRKRLFHNLLLVSHVKKLEWILDSLFDAPKMRASTALLRSDKENIDIFVNATMTHGHELSVFFEFKIHRWMLSLNSAQSSWTREASHSRIDNVSDFVFGKNEQDVENWGKIIEPHLSITTKWMLLEKISFLLLCRIIEQRQSRMWCVSHKLRKYFQISQTTFYWLSILPKCELTWSHRRWSWWAYVNG